MPSPAIIVRHAMDAAVTQAAAALRRGHVLIIPTETFYGLAVCAQDAAAVARLCALKGRAPSKPLPLIAADLDTVAAHCHLPEPMHKLACALWPGPLTLALEPKGLWPAPVLAGGHTLGVRVSAHPFAQALAREMDTLIVATSANLSGNPAVTNIADLDAALRYGAVCVDGGELTGGMPSSVVALAPGPCLKLLRPGAIDAGRIALASGLGWQA